MTIALTPTESRPADITDPDGPDLAALLDRVQELEQQLAAFHEEREHQARLATLGTIAGLIAHEFNNILTPVVSYAQMAMAAPHDAALTKRALERALAGAQRASEISGSILGFVRHEAPAVGRAAETAGSSDAGPFTFHVEQTGHQVLGAAKSPAAGNTCPKTTCSPLAVVHDTLRCIGRDLSQDGIEVTIDIPESLRLAVSPTALQHVLLNLILNSRRAMIGGTRANRRVERNTLRICATANPSAQRAPSMASHGRPAQSQTLSKCTERYANVQTLVCLTITDTGCGMSPAQLDRLFEPFAASRTRSQSAPDSGDRRASTGLGMTVCRRLVEAAGGDITVSSTPGIGTTVSITLPAIE